MFTLSFSRRLMKLSYSPFQVCVMDATNPTECSLTSFSQLATTGMTMDYCQCGFCQVYSPLWQHNTYLSEWPRHARFCSAWLKTQVIVSPYFIISFHLIVLFCQPPLVCFCFFGNLISLICMGPLFTILILPLSVSWSAHKVGSHQWSHSLTHLLLSVCVASDTFLPHCCCWYIASNSLAMFRPPSYVSILTS